MSFPIPNDLPPEVKNALAPFNATKVVTGPDGKPNVVPDDLAVGKTFDQFYDKANGNLPQIVDDSGKAIDAFSILTCGCATPSQYVNAAAQLATLVLAAGTAAAVKLGLITATAAITVIPVVGLIIAVLVVAALLIIKWFFTDEPQVVVKTDYQKFSAAINQIPGDIPFPEKLNPPIVGTGPRVPPDYYPTGTLGVINRLNEIFIYEQRGEDASSKHLELARIFGDNAGFVRDIYNIVADVLFNDRWQAGAIFNIQSNDILEWRAGRTSDGIWIIPRFVAGEYYFPGANNVNVREGEGQFAYWAEPNNPNHNLIGSVGDFGKNEYTIADGKLPIDKFPYGVGRYLLIFAVLYSLTDPKQARIATYSAVYLILIQKAWGYKAANREVPEGLYNSLGFLLDMISQSPAARAFSFLNPVSKARQTSQPIFHDVDWFVKGYLASAPAFVQEIPDIAPEIQGGAAVITEPRKKSPFTTLSPNASTGPMIGALTRGTAGPSPVAHIYPGNYLMEIDTLRHIPPEWIPQILYRYGIVPANHPAFGGTSIQEVAGPDGFRRYRFLTRVQRHLRLENIPGLRWALTRKLGEKR